MAFTIVIALVSQALAYYSGFGAVMFCLLCFYFIFTNLGLNLFQFFVFFHECSHLGTRQDGTLSAYSVFNEGGIRIAGSLNPESLESSLRGTSSSKSHSTTVDNSDNSDSDSVSASSASVRTAVADALLASKNLSRVANHACPCDSGAKIKKCCGSAGALLAAQQRANDVLHGRGESD